MTPQSLRLSLPEPGCPKPPGETETRAAPPESSGGRLPARDASEPVELAAVAVRGYN